MGTLYGIRCVLLSIIWFASVACGIKKIEWELMWIQTKRKEAEFRDEEKLNQELKVNQTMKMTREKVILKIFFSFVSTVEHLHSNTYIHFKICSPMCVVCSFISVKNNTTLAGNLRNTKRLIRWSYVHTLWAFMPRVVLSNGENRFSKSLTLSCVWVYFCLHSNLEKKNQKSKGRKNAIARKSEANISFPPILSFKNIRWLSWNHFPVLDISLNCKNQNWMGNKRISSFQFNESSIRFSDFYKNQKIIDNFVVS